MIDATSEILVNEYHRKKPWVAKDVLDLCDERRDLKKKQYEAEKAKEFREAYKRIQKAVKKQSRTGQVLSTRRTELA